MNFAPLPDSTEVTLRSGVTAYQIALDNYWIDFVPSGPELVVSFENLGRGGGPDGLRDCWALSYLKKRNFSVLGVKWRRADWYRGKSLHRFFRSDELRNFAAQFSKRSFMGGSMGGYGALAFSQVLPGSLVIAHNPQTTLDTKIVPWETRFAQGRRQDWSGDFSDTTNSAALARRLYMTYDPFDTPDRKHIERIPGDNVVLLKIPFTGHATPEWLLQMKVLSQVSDMALSEELTTENFAQLARARRNIGRYYLCMYAESKRDNFKELALSRGLQLSPPDPELVSLALRQYLNQGKYDLCIQKQEEMRTVASLLPGKQGELRALAGIAMHRAGRPAGQISGIVDAINENSRNAVELTASAEFLQEIGRFSDAARLGKRLIKIAPKVRDGYRTLAIAQRAMQRPRVALVTIEVAEKSCGGLGEKLKKLKQDLEEQIARTGKAADAKPMAGSS